MYLKVNLGFDRYKVCSLLSIEKYFLIIFLTINFLEIFRVLQGKFMIKDLGESIKYQGCMSTKEFVLYIYHQAKNNVLINDVYNQLKIA